MRLCTILLLSAIALIAADGVRPKVIAHRGGPASRPENTIAAFQHAIRAGVDVLEFDMNLTADDRIVIHHDTSVNSGICESRTKAVKPGPIRLLTLREIRQFDCGSRAPAAHPRQASVPGARMPSLEALLAAVRNSNVLLLAETKMPPAGAAQAVDPKRFIELMYSQVKKHGLASRFILQSGDYRTIDEMRKLEPSAGLCLLNARRFKPEYLAVARRHHATHLMLRTDDVDAGGVKQLQDAGLRVFSSTANSAAEWRRYAEMGIDGILTDDPEGLLEYLEPARTR